MKTVCDVCGAPLEPDGYCPYHQPSRTGIKQEVHQKKWTYYNFATVAFAIAALYGFFGNTLGFYQIPEPLLVLKYVVIIVTGLYFSAYFRGKGKTGLAMLFSANVALEVLLLVMFFIKSWL